MSQISRSRAAFAPVCVLLCALALSACAGDKKKKEELQYQERPVEILYDQAADNLDRRYWSQAATGFDEVERQHPYTEWARRAILMGAYADYQANKYDDAVEAARRFISLHPGNRSAPYAYYLIGVCYFEQILDVGRDQSVTTSALQALNEVVQRYPDSVYARDARIKIDMTNDQLAGKEMAVGRFYLNRTEHLAAINRFRNVVENYQTTSHTAEALYRLTEAYLSIGVDDQAQVTTAVLGYNFPGSKWYQDAYKLLNNKGLAPASKETVKKSWLGKLNPF
ncbi:MAG: outer membrane protein assembly factor BamD [Caulobacterales bacterium]